VAFGLLVAALVLGLVVVLPAFAANDADGADRADKGSAPAGAQPAGAEVDDPTSTTAAPTTSTTVSPIEAFAAASAAMTDEERVAMQLYFMTEAEREAFARLITPPAPAPAPAPEPVAPAVTDAPVSPSGSVWDELAYCETGGNWAHPRVGSYGYSGGLMFLPSTWTNYGGGEFAPEAYMASRDAQIVVAERILASHGGTYKAWPGCRAKLGLP
jgi:hypothetical protein